MAQKKKTSKKKTQSLSIFDFLKAITDTKEDLTTHPDFEKLYNPFMINRWLSMEKTLAIDAFYGDQILNSVSKKVHFKFLQNLIEEGKYFFQYKKAKPNDPDVNIISEYYNVNEDQAREIVNILSADQLKIIKDSFGGRKGK